MNKMRSLSNIALSLLVLTGITLQVAWSQSADTVFTLKSSIQYSLQHNPNSTIYNNEVEIARQRNIQALSTYLPQINGTVTVDYNPLLQTNILTVNGNEQTIRFGQAHTNGAVVQVDQNLRSISYSCHQRAKG